MIPTEVIERAREAALVDASRVETRLTMGSVDAALRSLLTDLRERFDTLYSPQMGYGDLERHPVDEVDALLREIGDE